MKTLLERYGESWRAAGRDITLIVVSILIAFALDAWWQRGRDLFAWEKVDGKWSSDLSM